jgi:hypothetical protein
LKSEYIKSKEEKYWLLNTDISSIFRPHSPTLPNRRYAYKPNNRIKGNKPVDIGYEFSCVGLSCRSALYGQSKPPWNLPLSMKLVPFEENKNTFTASQVNEILNNKELPFGDKLTVNALDSNYASPEYIVDTYTQKNLVNIIRIASNRNVWKKLSVKEQADRKKSNNDARGAKAVYGKQFKLKAADNWDLACEVSEFGIKTSKGKTYVVKVSIWDDMLFRTKRRKNMKDKPMRLVRVELFDSQTGLPAFKRCMWLGVWGKRNKELTGEEIFWCYRNRFDIEHFFRYGKQNLLLDKFQTPDEVHLQNWLEVVGLAYWLLWTAKNESKHETLKWRQYGKNIKNRKKYELGVSPSQVQRQMEGIILGFEQEPFLPKLQIKTKGRTLGQVMPKREKYPVRKKKKSPT